MKSVFLVFFIFIFSNASGQLAGVQAKFTIDYVNSYENYSFGCAGSCPCLETGDEDYTTLVKINDDVNIVPLSECVTCNNNGDCNYGVSQYMGIRNGQAYYANLKVHSWEDDSGDRCTFDSGDDCSLEIWDTIPFRETTFPTNNATYTYTAEYGPGSPTHNSKYRYNWNYHSTSSSVFATPYCNSVTNTAFSGKIRSFMIYLDPLESYTFSTCGPGIDTYLRLYDANGYTIVAQDDNNGSTCGGSQASFTYMSLTGGNHFIEISESPRLPLTSNVNLTVKHHDQFAPNPNSLPTINAECEVTSLTPATSIDICDGTILGTHDAVFPITGENTSTTVTWTFTDGSGNSSTATQIVNIDDGTPPVADVANLPTLYRSCSYSPTTFPTATDNCAGNLTGIPNVTLPITTEGTTVVTWNYNDGNGNGSTQTQNVIIDDITAPVSDSVSLMDLISVCEITSLTPPTATDECATTVTVTHDAILPINTEGTTVVTWTFDDGHGNTSTQTQNVIIDDILAPVPDSISLVDLTEECEILSLTPPTGTDECAAIVTVTHDATLPINIQGTTLVTWTFGDGHGNTSTQTQNVVITDITPPTASNPNDISVQCIGDVPNPSVGFVTDESDNCGTTTVTWGGDVSDGLTCPETITRTFIVTDAVGLSISVEQTITVIDQIAPIADSMSLATEINECEITLTAPTATDYCSGSITGISDHTFPITALGTTSVTWSFTDNCGNTSTQSQEVEITGVNTGIWVDNDAITIVSRNISSGVTYQWIDCSDNNTPLPNETNHFFTPTYNSNFAVIITENNCSDTSDCVTIMEVGIDDLKSGSFNIYPNPTVDGTFTVSSSSTIESIQIVDLLGHLIILPIDLKTGYIDGSKLSPGKYIVKIKIRDKTIFKEIMVLK